MEISVRVTVPDELMRYTNKAFNKRSLCAVRSKQVFAPLNRLGEQKKICSCDDYGTAEKVAAAMNIAYPPEKGEQVEVQAAQPSQGSGKAPQPPELQLSIEPDK